MTSECADWEDIRSIIHDQKRAQSLVEKAWQKGFKLSNNLALPALGLGTCGLPNFPKTSEIVSYALETGYRLIDTSGEYENEASIGDGIVLSGIPRKHIQITTKIPKRCLGYQATMDAFFHSLNEMDVEYIDLLLLQWPMSPHENDQWEECNYESWKALVELYGEGYVNAIGVANFMPHHLRRLLESPVPPMVNQLEFHPGWAQLDSVMYCQAHDILVQGWGIFGDARLLSEEVILSIAQKYQCTPAELCLQYALQHKVLPLPRSGLAQNIMKNLEIVEKNIVISDEDMHLLDRLSEKKLAYSGECPDRN